MAAASDVLDDNLNDCFEPRADDPMFTEITLRRSSEIMAPSSTISVCVSSPEKYSSFTETYVRYNVKTESSREEFMNQVYEVYRRYNDFLWLKNRLEESNPTLIIPPFPPKHSIGSIDRFNGPFIIARCRALGMFINRVCAHHVLSSSDDLFHFLTIRDDGEWTNYKRVHNAVGHDLGSKMKSILQIGEISPEFADCIPKLNSCQEACESLIDTSRVRLEEEKSLSKDLTNYAATLSQWSSGSGHVPKLGRILYQIGQVLEIQAQDLVPTTQCIQTKLIPELVDLTDYAECFKRVANRRDKLQGNIRDTNDNADNLERSMDTPSSVTRKIRRESVAEERQRRESQVSQLRARSESLKKSLEVANTDLRTESERWSNHRNIALRMSLLDFAGLRAAHHRRLDQQWRRLVQEVWGGDTEHPQRH